MIFRLVLIALLIVTTVSLPAQRKAKKERAEKINAIYVPRDIYDAHKELDKKTTEDYQSQIRNWKEKNAIPSSPYEKPASLPDCHIARLPM